MKLATFSLPDSPSHTKLGAIVDGNVVDLGLIDPSLPASMLEFIRLGDPSFKAAAKALAETEHLPQSSRPLSSVKLHAPIPQPGKIFCSGLNYSSHVQENPKAKFLDDPRFFAKTPNTVIGPGDSILHPGEKYQVDYEVELAVVIGQRMPQGAPAERVMEHVFGYTILHVVSSRWIQFKDNNEVMGKNFDSFCPIGPCVVTADEIPDPSKLRLWTLLNGKAMQDGTNEDWRFPLPRLLAWLSQATTLEPGDQRDLEVFVSGLLDAESQGRRFIYRTAASFVTARSGLVLRRLLGADDLSLPASGPGLIIAGSHVPQSTEQIARLQQAESDLVSVEIKVPELQSEPNRAKEVERVQQTVDDTLRAGKKTLVYTSRSLVLGADPADSLALSRRVSIRPRYIIAKGGITSSDVATRSLEVKRTMVCGQLLPGVPMWELGTETRFPGLKYVVFPGNVGGPDALADAVHKLNPCRTGVV